MIIAPPFPLIPLLLDSGLLAVNSELLAHSGENGDIWINVLAYSAFFLTHSYRLTGVLLLLGEELADLVANLTVGDLDVVLGVAIVLHQGQEVVVGDVKLGESS